MDDSYEREAFLPVEEDQVFSKLSQSIKSNKNSSMVLDSETTAAFKSHNASGVHKPKGQQRTHS